jgi:hypothetical protein
MHETGDIDQRIDTTDFGGAGCDRRGIGDIQRADTDAGFTFEFFELIQIEIGRNDLAALCGQGQSRGTSDTLGGSSDQNFLTGDTSAHDVFSRVDDAFKLMMAVIGLTIPAERSIVAFSGA